VTDPPASLDLASPDAVIGVLNRGRDANLSARCRKGAIDLAHAPGRLVATGDLHDNPEAFAAVVALAGLDTPSDDTPPPPRAHLTLHELIHSGRLMNGMDFSYRVLAKAAALKAAFPELVHTLLGNHELAQVAGSGITKDGVPVVRAFNDGVEYVFGDEASRVQAAINAFIRSMPLALRCTHTPHAPTPAPRPSPCLDTLCAHSLPAAGVPFDTSILDRDLTDADYTPRQGSAHAMVWGRGHPTQHVATLAEQWGVGLFILGHEHAPTGAMLVPPCAVVLNTDHENARCLELDLAKPIDAHTAVARALPLLKDARP
jgi:hypothetical protein